MWVKDLATAATGNGFNLRSKWLQSTTDTPDYVDAATWIDHVTGTEGAGGAISKMLSPEEALALGDRFGEHLVRELKPFMRLLDAIYSETPPATVPASPTSVPRSALTIEWLVEETLWDRADIERVLDTMTQQMPQVILAGPPGTSKT